MYGSDARGDANAESGIDVLIALDAALEIERIGDIVSQLSLKHNMVVSCFVSKERWLREHNSTLINARAEGIAV